MKLLIKWICFSFIFLAFCLNESNSSRRGINGGLSCAMCTILTGVVQQRAYLKGVSLYNGAKYMCTRLPEHIQQSCLSTVKKLKPILDNTENLETFTPDVFCYAFGICHVDPGENFCHLFPEPIISFDTSYTHIKNAIIDTISMEKENDVYSSPYLMDEELNSSIIIEDFLKNLNFHKDSPFVDLCSAPILKDICKIFQGTDEGFTPAFDLDNDGFSTVETARGSNWRGKDCNDVDNNIYPGAQTRHLDINEDSNCNGIWGVDNETSRPWEDLLCENTESKGIIYVGDSIGAHFHFPQAWMNPNIEDNTPYSTMLKIILDELDWPQISFSTGYKNSSYPDLINGTTDSIYLRLRNRNRCNHRDFQNAARNSAMSFDFANLIKSFTRHPYDKPSLLIFGMMGNDVCNRFPETVGNMTTVEQFRKLLLDGLTELDRKLPKNSDVVLVALVDGHFIYPSMAERVHPLGTVLNNIKYKDVYKWFSCMQISPCNGWMTANTTLREITSQRSKDLSAVLKELAETKNYISFKLHYVDNPINGALSDWVKQGGQIHELIDPIDSLHADQLAQPLLAEQLWNALEKINILGLKNKNNDKIKELFGNQGGH